MSTRIFARNAFETGLDGGIGDSETTITLDTTVGLSFPGILVVSDDSPTLREYVEYTGISASDLTGVTRGGEGSAGGTAHAHGTGARVRSVYVHQIQDRLWDDIEALEAFDTAHLAAGDPHTGYVLESAHDKAQHDAFGLDHGLLSGLADDDHTQYHDDARALTWLGTRATTDLPEGTNLYYTDVRADARIAAASIADLLTKDHDLLTGLADDDHTQYHTDARAVTWLGTRSIADLGAKAHDLLTGLGDDDHTLYARANGARTYTGTHTFTGIITGPTVRAATGSTSAPGLSFASFTNYGFYPTTNVIDVGIANARWGRFEHNLSPDTYRLYMGPDLGDWIEWDQANGFWQIFRNSVEKFRIEVSALKANLGTTTDSGLDIIRGDPSGPGYNLVVDTSDERMKRDIHPADQQELIKGLRQIELEQWQAIDSADDSRWIVGVSANKVEQMDNERLVSYVGWHKDSGMRTFDPVATLSMNVVAAVQYLLDRDEELVA